MPSATSASSWKCVANSVRHWVTSYRYPMQACAMDSPSYEDVPRPASSRITKQRSVAPFRIAAVSCLSTRIVDLLEVRSADASLRLNTLPTTPMRDRRANAIK